MEASGHDSSDPKKRFAGPLGIIPNIFKDQDIWNHKQLFFKIL